MNWGGSLIRGYLGSVCTRAAGFWKLADLPPWQLGPPDIAYSPGSRGQEDGAGTCQRAGRGDLRRRMILWDFQIPLIRATVPKMGYLGCRIGCGGR